jgi:hypothetical protein
MDEHGAMFPRIPMYNITDVDSRYLWLLISMLASVPSFWKATTGSVTCTSQWPGWVLARMVKDCFKKHSPKDLRSKPFKLNTTMAKAQSYIVGRNAGAFDMELFQDKLRVLSGVKVVSSLNLFAEKFQFGAAVSDTIVVCRSAEHDFVDLPSVLPANESGLQWELQYVATTTMVPDQRLHKWTGKFFAGHGGKKFAKWWVQDRRDKSATRCATAELESNTMALWCIAVYVTVEAQDMEMLGDTI